MDRIAFIISLFYIFLRALNPNIFFGQALNRPPEPMNHGFNILFNCLPVFACALTFLSIGKKSEEESVVRIPKFLLFVVVLVVFGFISLKQSAYPLATLVHVEFMMGLCAFLCVLANNSELRRSAIPIVVGLVFAGVVYSAVQLYTYGRLSPEEAARAQGFDPVRNPEFLSRFSTSEVFGISFYPNTWAAVVAFGILIFCGWLRSGSKLAASAVIVILLVTLYFTDSKGGWAGCALGFMWLLAARFVRAKPVTAYLTVIVLFAVVVATAAYFLSNHPSMSLRRTYWQAAADIGKEYPTTGCGLGTYSEYFSKFKGESPEEVRFAHNDFTQLFAETGIGGAIAFALLLLMMLHKLTRSADESTEEFGRVDVAVPIVFLISVLLAFFMFGRFNEFIIAPLLLAGGFLGGYVLATRFKALPVWAVAGAFFAYFLHSGADFLFYDNSVILIVFTAASVVVCKEGIEVGLGRAFSIAVCAGLVMFGLFCAWGSSRSVNQHAALNEKLYEKLELTTGSVQVIPYGLADNGLSCYTKKGPAIVTYDKIPPYPLFRCVARFINKRSPEDVEGMRTLVKNNDFLGLALADAKKFGEFAQEMIGIHDDNVLDPAPMDAVIQRGFNEAASQFFLIQLESSKESSRPRLLQAYKTIGDTYMMAMEYAMERLKKIRPRHEFYHELMCRTILAQAECGVIFGEQLAGEVSGLCLKAIDESKQALDLYPVSPHLNLLMARCQVFYGRKDEARNYLQVARKFNSNLPAHKKYMSIPDSEFKFIEDWINR